MNENGERWRVRFDAEVTFSNGGGLQTQGFRLDVSGPDIGDREVADLFVRQLGLLMVDDVRITGRETISEPHKGTRNAADSRAAPGPYGAADRSVIELSHTVRHGMITYPGLPGPEISDHISREASRNSYAPGTEFVFGRISMVSNTGTYLDSPFHRFPDGPDLAGLPLGKLTDLDGVVVRVLGSERRSVERELLLPHDVAGRAVLIHTGWSRHWGTEQYANGYPYLTADAAEWLVEQGAALVGIDSLNIDDADDGTRPTHTALLAAGIPIVEHLRGLEHLPPNGFRFHAAPPAIEGMGTFPVRAYAVVGSS
ncbi:cyclase family protein [Streptomyces zagrosensis]|uniref:Kynurenine formamidase n=1 Tax=Streptomyces zagrosensis TaxID=1042984 RepID=A0A7W9UX59_9ACTN|nr:cyclase family protein [Streptomyces zagrosensis]MBB5933946.1 kynurenine formamidase [Streptomyces zagrosensis]